VIKMIKLEISNEELNLLMNSLGNMPYAQVFHLIESIRSQAVPQLDIAQSNSVVQ
jgi:hypothetical protein